MNQNKSFLLKKKSSMMTPACNPSYMGGRNRRIRSLRKTQAKLVRPYLENKQKENQNGLGA
jgi:hypothetical protein